MRVWIVFFHAFMIQYFELRRTLGMEHLTRERCYRGLDGVAATVTVVNPSLVFGSRNVPTHLWVY